jgi:hypothetical protein
MVRRGPRWPSPVQHQLARANSRNHLRTVPLDEYVETPILRWTGSGHDPPGYQAQVLCVPGGGSMERALERCREASRVRPDMRVLARVAAGADQARHSVDDVFLTQRRLRIRLKGSNKIWAAPDRQESGCHD